MIRETTVRGKTAYVIIDIIRECNPNPKPSKLWSEYKKRVGALIPFSTHYHDFKSSNGRIYNLECVREKDRKKVEELFAPKKVPVKKVEEPNYSKDRQEVKTAFTVAKAEKVIKALEECAKAITAILQH